MQCKKCLRCLILQLAGTGTTQKMRDKNFTLASREPINSFSNGFSPQKRNITRQIIPQTAPLRASNTKESQGIQQSGKARTVTAMYPDSKCRKTFFQIYRMSSPILYL